MSSETTQTGKNPEPNTAFGTGKVLERPTIIYFDNHCPLCRQLALFMESHLPATDFQFSPTNTGESLQVRTPDLQDLFGKDAWSWLLTHHPRLSGLGWLAAKLHLSETTATFVARGADILRRMCYRCGRT